MTTIGDLPEPVATTVVSSWVCEFATVSRAGVPIDTQLVCAVDPAEEFVPVSTGLAYPAKAERARREPKVGLLFEAPDGGPVVSMQAFAAVRDADIYANAVRYARSFPGMLAQIMGPRSWADVRGAYWYWARIFIECAPVSVSWWPSAAATDGPPEQWSPPAPVAPPVSDPAPAGPPSPSSGWAAVADWRARAAEVAAAMPPPHLTVVDPDGFPRPFRVRAATPTDTGFALRLPQGPPWLGGAGTATLSFDGQATFVGRVSGAAFDVERILPDLPLVVDPGQIFDPAPEIRGPLLARVQAELERRGQQPPVLPEEQPLPA